MKFFVNFNRLDLEGYRTIFSGMVSKDYGETHNEDDALVFETREEAEAWCCNADEYGWNPFAFDFDVWSYDE